MLDVACWVLGIGCRLSSVECCVLHVEWVLSVECCVLGVECRVLLADSPQAETKHFLSRTRAANAAAGYVDANDGSASGHNPYLSL